MLKTVYNYNVGDIVTPGAELLAPHKNWEEFLMHIGLPSDLNIHTGLPLEVVEVLPNGNLRLLSKCGGGKTAEFAPRFVQQAAGKRVR